MPKFNLGVGKVGLSYTNENIMLQQTLTRHLSRLFDTH